MNGPIAQLEPPLRALGIDLFSTFDVATYNERVARKPVSPLPSFGRGGALGVVIGNTRAMWPWFLAAHRARRALQKTSDPLDAFVADAVTNVGHAPETGPMSRFLVELFGMAGRPTPPTDLKWTWGDREALARAASQVAAWPFDRIVLAHGRLIDVQARKVWRDAYAFVLQDP